MSINTTKLSAIALSAIVAASLSLGSAAYATGPETSASSADAAIVNTITTAANTKKVTINKCDYAADNATIKEKAKEVKKGKTKLVLKKGQQGWISFTATESKTYKFKFSGLSKKAVCGFVSACKLDGSDTGSYAWEKVKMSTKGGKSDVLWLAAKGYATKSGKKVDRFLTSRTGKVKLEAGETVYFYNEWPSYSGKATLKLNVK